MVSGENKDHYNFVIIEIILIDCVYLLSNCTTCFAYFISFNIGKYPYVCFTDEVTGSERQHGQRILANKLCNWDSSSADSNLEFLALYYIASSLNLVDCL